MGKLYTLLALLIAAIVLISCQGASIPPGEEGSVRGTQVWIHGSSVIVLEVDLPDGRTIPCVMVSDNGVDCDWGER